MLHTIIWWWWQWGLTQKKFIFWTFSNLQFFRYFFSYRYSCFCASLSNCTRMLCCHSTYVHVNVTYIRTKALFCKIYFFEKMSCVLAFVPVDVIHFVNNLSTVTGLRQPRHDHMCLLLVLTSPPALHPQTHTHMYIWFKIRFIMAVYTQNHTSAHLHK